MAGQDSSKVVIWAAHIWLTHFYERAESVIKGKTFIRGRKIAAVQFPSSHFAFLFVDEKWNTKGRRRRAISIVVTSLRKKKKEKLSRKILTYDLRATTPLFRPLLVIYEEGLTQTLWFVFINS